MKEEKRMLEMLNKMWIGATCRLHNFVEDFKHEEKGAAKISSAKLLKEAVKRDGAVAILLVIVVVIAVVVVFRERIMDLVSNTFDDADKVKDISFLEIGNLKTLL